MTDIHTVIGHIYHNNIEFKIMAKINGESVDFWIEPVSVHPAFNASITAGMIHPRSGNLSKTSRRDLTVNLPCNLRYHIYEITVSDLDQYMRNVTTNPTMEFGVRFGKFSINWDSQLMINEVSDFLHSQLGTSTKEGLQAECMTLRAKIVRLESEKTELSRRIHDAEPFRRRVENLEKRVEELKQALSAKKTPPVDTFEQVCTVVTNMIEEGDEDTLNRMSMTLFALQLDIGKARASREECSICCDRKVNTILVPCGHTLCKECGERLTQCPYCRARINSRTEIDSSS